MRFKEKERNYRTIRFDGRRVRKSEIRRGGGEGEMFTTYPTAIM